MVVLAILSVRNKKRDVLGYNKTLAEIVNCFPQIFFLRL